MIPWLSKNWISLIALIASIYSIICQHHESAHNSIAKAVHEYTHKMNNYNDQLNKTKHSDNIKQIKRRIISYVGQWSEIYINSKHISLKNAELIRECLPNSAHLYDILASKSFMNSGLKTRKYYMCLENFHNALVKCDILKNDGGNRHVQ